MVISPATVLFATLALLFGLCPTIAVAQEITAEYVINMERRLPTDPGAKGRLDFIGVDANTNGVRDDVEIWVSKTFSDDMAARAAALQIGVAMQQVFAAGERVDMNIMSQLKSRIRDAIECVLASLGEVAQEQIFGEMLGVIVNTPERADLIEKHERNYPEINGTEIPAPSAAACNIQIDKLTKEN